MALTAEQPQDIELWEENLLRLPQPLKQKSIKNAKKIVKKARNKNKNQKNMKWSLISNRVCN